MSTRTEKVHELVQSYPWSTATCTTCTWKPEWDSAPTLVSCPGRGRSGNETGWTRVSKFEMMSVLHRGKSTILQTFPAEDVVRWKERLSTAPPEGRHSPACKCLWYLVSDLLFKKNFFWALYCFLVSRSGNLTLVVYFYLLLLWFLFSFYSRGVTFWSPWSSYSSRSAGDTQEGEPHLSMTNQLYQSCEHKIHSLPRARMREGVKQSVFSVCLSVRWKI